MKTIKYKGHTITIEKITGWIATIEDEKGEVIDHEESIGLSDRPSDAAEVAKEFIDAIEVTPTVTPGLL